MNISTSSDGGSLKGNKEFNIRGTGTIGKGSSVSPLVPVSYTHLVSKMDYRPDL